LTITATSSNPGLIPDPLVSYTSPNATGSLSFTPLANANGTAVITVTVKDNGGTALADVDTPIPALTRTPTSACDAPTLDPTSHPTLHEFSFLQSVPLTGIPPCPTRRSSDLLTITATSSNPGLIPNPLVSYTSPDATGSLSFTPLANANGTAVITVTVKDNG